jgi:HK97 family phage major capsid protein
MKIAIGNEKMKCWKSEDGRYGHVEALGIRFANHEEPDLVGDFFNAETYFGKHRGNGMDATLNHTYPIVTKDEESNNVLKAIADMKFSNPVESQMTDMGIVASHVLDLANDHEKFVYELAEQGAFTWSSGAISHTVRYVPVGDSYLVKRWDIGEWAYTPTPAEPRLPKITSIKSLERGQEKPDSDNNNQSYNNKESNQMDEKQIRALIDNALKAYGDKNQAPDVAAIVEATVKNVLENQENPDVEKLVNDAVDKAVKAFEEKLPAINDAGKNVNVARMSNLWKYDHMGIEEHALGLQVLTAANKSGYASPAALDMAKSLAIKVANDKETDIDNRPKHSRTKSAMAKSFKVNMTDKEIHAAKADELNYSTQAGYGDEWIGVAYANELWPRIVQDTPIINKIPTMEVPQGAESVVIPLDGTPPTFYKVAQATSQGANPGDITKTVTTSKQATAQQTMTVSKLGAAVNWTGELNEDAVVNFAAEMRRNIQNEAAEVMEHLAIDGDTATGATTNINDIGGTPAGTEAFLTLNGFRKLALVTNTANSRDGGALALTDFLETIKLMGLAGRNAVRKDRVGFILDLWSHWKALELTEIATQDVFSRPTIENGMLASIYGYDVVASANMHRANQDATYGLKANSAGKLDLDTAANNTTGSLLAVRWDQWRWGFKRRISFEVERVPRADAYEITALMRVGMIYRDTEAAAISYNLTV